MNRVTITLVVVLTTIVTLIAFWPTIERLVSPGPLTRSHAPFEKSCSTCHIAFTPLAEGRKCKSCHDSVASDIQGQVGFHGRTEEVRNSQCRTCHAEHRGRDARLVDLRQARFDHAKTDFVLGRGHRGLQCSACHLPGTKFRTAPSMCASCHLREDVHQGRFGGNCAACHTDAGWKFINRFDHSLTGFPLVGAHGKTSCTDCHVGGRKQGTPRTCKACHAQDDVHEGANGSDCASCHTLLTWRNARFNHDRTRFPLVGRHAAASCVSCHGAGHVRPRPPTTCISCHRQKDVHRGSQGTNCGACHSPKSWKGARFDHDTRTRFPLAGAHRGLACVSCHTRPVASFKPPTACVACHARDDAHRGSLGRGCASCHASTRWTPAASFNHAATRFSLTGAHTELSCNRCHRDQRFRAAGTTCASCHADTVHKGRFGSPSRCESCHTTFNWRTVTFVHDRTRFRLTGRHARLSCNACHKADADKVRLPGTCVSCHKADDPHEGRFGNRCETCHTSGESFRPVRVSSRSAKARGGGFQ